ncbi:MAG: hypothetical protein WB676_30800 [Bryobacteraceae bacterium]
MAKFRQDTIALVSVPELDHGDISDPSAVGAEARESNARGNYFPWIAGIVCLLSLVIFFRDFLESGFNLIAGNLGDNRFIIAILEHWRAVAHGRASFRSPNFFWPEHGVLGYSESLFLFSLPYAVGRAAGLDLYIAFELTLILFKAVGFFSMLWLLRSFVRVSRSVALVGSTLFTISNLYFIDTGHAHLMTVVFVPLLACLACAGWLAYGRGQKGLGHIYSGLLGLLLALVLFTSFYIGWFAILAGGVAFASAVLLRILQARSLSPLREWSRLAVGRSSLLATALLVFYVAIIPFLITYLPTLKQTSGRAFQENRLYSSRPVDLLNIGEGNWIWGRAVDSLMIWLGNGPMAPTESQRGWPPLTLALIAAGLFLGFRRKEDRGRAGLLRYDERFLAAVLGVSFITGWVLSVKVGERSLWWLVFKFIPGGSAVRVPARFNLVLNVFAIILACLVLNGLAKQGRRVWKVVFWAVSFFLIAEQINTAPAHLIRRDSENAILARVGRPPSTCRSFFLTHPARRPGKLALLSIDQIDPMLIARSYNIPTLNGYSGWFPPGWDFFAFGRGYLQNVRWWARRKEITSGLCGLDLRDGSWTPVNFTKTPYRLGWAIDFHAGGNADFYEAQGWSHAEEVGSWTVGAHSVLILDLQWPPTSDLWLTFKAHAFVVPQHPSFKETLRVNNSEVAEWSITDPQVEKRVRLPLNLIRSRPLRIEFFDHDPRSPAELGLSTDVRKLGLAIETLKLEPDSPGLTIDFRRGGNARPYETEGWSEAEDEGTWALGGHSVLSVNLPALPAVDCWLLLAGHAFTPPQHPSFEETMRVNGKEVAEWSITDPQVEKRVRLPRNLVRSRLLRIEFFDRDPRSPAELGLSPDDRKLGLALENLELEPARSPAN